MRNERARNMTSVRRCDGGRRALTRATAALAAAVMVIALTGCSDDSAADTNGSAATGISDANGSAAPAVSGATGGTTPSTGDDDTAAPDTDPSDTDPSAAGPAAGGTNQTDHAVFAGIPVIDGETAYDRSGTKTDGRTDWASIGVKTGLATLEAADQVRDGVTAAGLTELSWAASETGDGQAQVRALYDHGEVLLKLEVDPDGGVGYEAIEMPAGSFAEREFACQALRKVSVEATTGLMLTPIVTGKPVTSDAVAFAFAYADPAASLAPGDVADALAALRDAASGTVGLDAGEMQRGSAAADAVESAGAALDAATSEFCAA